MSLPVGEISKIGEFLKDKRYEPNLSLLAQTFKNCRLVEFKIKIQNFEIFLPFWTPHGPHAVRLCLCIFFVYLGSEPELGFCGDQFVLLFIDDERRWERREILDGLVFRQWPRVAR
jgi:hypothetical protein